MANPVLLIADDNADLLKQLQRDLERRYGEQYRVITASSGQAALTTLQQLKKKEDRVALILVDHRLPDMPAGEFLDQARALFNDAKIVFLTTVGESEETISEIKKFRVDDYLIKPCQPPEQNLYPTINDLLTDWEARVSVEGLRVIGSRFSSEAHQIRDFLVRNCIPFEWLDVDRDKEEMRRILNVSELESSRLPVVVFPDGTRQTRPTNAEIAQKIGLKIRPEG
ncbi:MAG TPA: response regulator, partial [Pyrinomonadaceae bacterium]